MSVPGDVIGWLAQRGLDRADIMQAVYALQHGEPPPGAVLSPAATDAIQHLNEAGLNGVDEVNRVVNYLSTGQDPEGDQERAAQAQQAAAPPRVLAEDPAYLAYQRALGVEDATDETATNSQADTLRRAVGDQLAQLTTNGDRARQSIDGNFEARGVYRSGAHEQRLGEQRQDEGTQASAIQSQLASQVGDLTQQLAQRKAARQRTLADQGLNTASNLYVS